MKPFRRRAEAFRPVTESLGNIPKSLGTDPEGPKTGPYWFGMAPGLVWIESGCGADTMAVAGQVLYDARVRRCSIIIWRFVIRCSIIYGVRRRIEENI
jgi:hypothetical protein